MFDAFASREPMVPRSLENDLSDDVWRRDRTRSANLPSAERLLSSAAWLSYRFGEACHDE